MDVFRQELTKLGWIEGNNIVFEYRFAEQKRERVPELAADLVRRKVDLISVTGRAPGLAANKRYHYHSHRDDVLSGSRGRRFGCQPCATGRQCHRALKFRNRASYQTPRDTQGRSSQAHPSRSSATGGSPPALIAAPLKDLVVAAQALKLKFAEIIETQAGAKSSKTAFQTAKQKQVGAIMTPSGGRLFFGQRKRIVELAGKYRLPAIYPQKEFVDEGGLMSYAADFDDLYRHAAVYVDKILKGAKPADLPVQQATKFEFVINLKAAKQIGLTVPPEVLARANKVIK